MNKRIKTLLIIGIVVFLVIAIISGWKVVSILKNYRDSERTYEDAAEEYTIWDEEAADAEPTPMTAEDFREAVENPRRPILDVDFASLQAENGDVFGWIYSKGSQINYPVVQGSDNVFYMDHLYNEEWNPGGAIFMDYRNLPAFESGNSILYGHHMEDGSMFENVTKFADQEYMNSHAIVWFLTPEQDFFRRIAQCDADLLYAAFPQQKQYMLQHRFPHKRHHGFRQSLCYRSQPHPFSARHHNCLRCHRRLSCL